MVSSYKYKYLPPPSLVTGKRSLVTGGLVTRAWFCSKRSLVTRGWSLDKPKNFRLRRTKTQHHLPKDR